MKAFLTSFILICLTLSSYAQTPKVNSSNIQDTLNNKKNQQLILWTSSDREAALKMVCMYLYNCKKYGWMDNVRLLVWGPSGKLLTEDNELQKNLEELKKMGVELYACKACADLYGITDKLTKLGITVVYTGQMLADLQKAGWFILSI